MAVFEGLGVFVGAAAIGLLHGAEPGHGWPIAATYALNKRRPWASGLLASTLLGLGHLVSSIAVVFVFFFAKSYFELTELGWIRYVAGVLLIALGIREYYRGGHSHGDPDDHVPADDHSHGHAPADHDGTTPSLDIATAGHSHSHDGDGHPHGEHSHSHGEHDHAHTDDTAGGWRSRLSSRLPSVGHSHDHDGGHFGDPETTDLAGLVTTAFVLGFVHEEEFEIIGLCLGSDLCLSLMLVYALAVIVGLVGLTMLLLAGYSRYEERVEEYAEYLPLLSATVLILLGFGFIFGVV